MTVEHATVALPEPHALCEKDALFLDFDGTLAGLQDDPDQVFLAPDMAPVLIDLSAKLSGALAILSGRGLSDLAKRVPQSVWRFGNHGLFSAAPGETPQDVVPTVPELAEKLATLCTALPGVRVETKGPVFAVHYRAAPAYGADLGALLDVLVREVEGYKLQHGKCVYELKPVGANKGICLSAALEHAPFQGRRPIMIGDDTTDEDAFKAALSKGGLAIKVGEGETSAPYRLADVDAVHTLLKNAV